MVEKMKCKVMYQYPTCDMHFVHRKNELISGISFGILYIFKRYFFLQMFFFNKNKKTRFFTIIAFKVFQSICEFVSGNMDRIMIRSISKLQR